MYLKLQNFTEEKTGMLPEIAVSYQSILDSLPDVIITTDLDFRILTWNKKATAVYGITEADAKGHRFDELVRLQYLNSLNGNYLTALEQNGAWKGDVAFTNNNGEVHYLVQSLTYIADGEGKPAGILLTGKNSAPPLHPTETIRGEKFYHSLVADSLDGILLLNAYGQLTFASPSVQQILGYTPEEIIGKTAFEFVHPEDFFMATTSFTRELNENPEIKFIVVRLRKKDDQWLWCMVRGHNLLSNPHVNGIVIYFHDDTLRKSASEALKESKERFKKLVRDLQTGVLLMDAAGNITMSNNAVHKIFQADEASITGKKSWELLEDVINEEERPLLQDERPVYKAFTTKKLVTDVVVGVLIPSTKKRVWLIVSADPILNEEGEVQMIVCSFIDITQRKKLERKLLAEQLSHQRRLTQASIDSQEKERREIGKELHDNIGQQLTTIKLYLDLAMSTANEETAEMISLSIRNVSDVINEIRGLCRSLIPSTLGDLGLIECINDLTASLLRTQKLQIDVLADMFDEDKVPENQKLMLFRIIQEQLNNTVKHAEAKKISIVLQNDDDQLSLIIMDDGKGFDEKTIRKGLGLTSIRNRAELFGGTVTITSTAGKGCLTTVSVPLSVPVY